jgi:putative MATE family efflux protein
MPMKKIFITKPQKNQLIEGSITSSILVLAFPLLVRAGLQSLQSVIDMFWVGKLGSTSIAAISMGGTVIMALIPLFFGIATGTVALISRNIGSHYYHQANEIAAQSLIMAFISSLFFVILGLSISKPILQLLQAKGEVLILGEAYLKILLLGGITTALLFLGGAILQGAGDATTPMHIMGSVTVLNIILDPLLIFGLFGLPKMGVSGAALATVLAQAIGASLILFIIFKGKSHIHVLFKKIKINLKLICQILKIGIPTSLQLFFRTLMNMFLISIVAGFGTYAIAAYGISMRLHMLILMPAFALGQASATLVGQNLGAEKKERAKKCANMSTLFDVFLMCIFAILFFTFSKQIISIFNYNPQIIKEGSHLLRITAPFFPFIALGVIFSKSLQGAGETIPPMIITLVTLWGLQIPLAIILSKYFQWGTVGIWWAMAFSSLANGSFTFGWFATGRWQHRKFLQHEFA